MPKPVLIAVDDEAGVLGAIERDLRRRFGERYRVMRAESGTAALALVDQLIQRGDAVALLLSDQRMPVMNGVELLSAVRERLPAAKRVLLTAYADSAAAIHAINDAGVDYYLVKPWEPPDEQFYPVLEDLLADWQANFTPAYEGIRIVGQRWSPATHHLKDFLARNQVPYLWLDFERAEVASSPEAAGLQPAELPLVLLPDGSRLANPTVSALAERVGLQTKAKLPFYDLAIVGAGPAGLAAAVYGASEGLSTVLIEREAPGGQAGTSSRIENYLGFPVGLGGADLARRGVAQARRFGVEILTPCEALGLRTKEPYRVLALSDGRELACRALIVATGVTWRRLEVPGVERLLGAGVYYGAANTEASACQDEAVYIVGGANSAGQAAMYLSRFARKVTILVRGDSVRKSMSEYLVVQLEATPNIEIRTHTGIVEAHGETHLAALTLRDLQANTQAQVPAASLFVMIGAVAHTDWLGPAIARDAHGFLLAGGDLTGSQPPAWHLAREPFLLETSLPGVFVAGDVRHGSLKRIASSVGEGSVSVAAVHQYLASTGA